MKNPNVFAAEPLDRASADRADPAWVRARLDDPASLVLPLYRGDPLIAGGAAAFLTGEALSAAPREAPVVFLGAADGKAHFALDVSAAPSPESAPFADIGVYTPLREAAESIDEGDLALIGQGRWLFDWHQRHGFCARCGGETTLSDGGAKRACAACGAEHFPRCDPVAIVLAVHEDACLLGRGPHFPPGFLSALAGFVEAAETPEQCAVRELREEAGVRLLDVRYQFSQPWPFPASLMMGFIADAQSRDLNLDQVEIVEAKWLSRAEINALRAGERRDDVRLPPHFTIARQLIERWATSPPDGA